MYRIFRNTQIAVTVMAFTLGAHAASLIVNGDFSQIGPFNPVIFNSNAQQFGMTAALNWQQFKVVPNSYLVTRDELIGFGPTRELHVWTNAGPWGPSAMGNGFAQSFPKANCATASFWVKVMSGQVTGNLITAAGPFLFFPQFTAAGTWKHYTEVSHVPVAGIGFETLVGPGAEYHVADVQVNSCLTLVPVKDLSQYVTYDPFYYIKNPGGPVEKIRVLNRSNQTIEGPIHLLLEEIARGRTVLDPDGDYDGSPFITLQARALAPGESEEVTIHFDAESTGAIPTFKPKLISGSF